MRMKERKETFLIPSSKVVPTLVIPLSSCDISQPNTVVSIIYVFSYTISKCDLVRAIGGKKRR
jgi:hypothetical protein